MREETHSINLACNKTDDNTKIQIRGTQWESKEKQTKWQFLPAKNAKKETTQLLKTKKRKKKDWN